jgi:hypothetical protein
MNLPPETFPTPILEVVVGSTLHGTNVADGLEDLDLMAIVIERPHEFVGLNPIDTWVHRTKPNGVRSEAGDTDLAVYGLRKYLSLALKGNPTVLLALFAPQAFVRRIDTRGRDLQALAPRIVSKKAYAPFRGYMKQQQERLLGSRGQKNCTRPELVEKYGFDTKYASHVVRLGYQGCELLKTGRLTLPMPEAQREIVRDIRSGKWRLEDVSEMIDTLETSLTGEYNRSPLPEAPDYLAVERWMIERYVSAWHANLIGVL